MALLYRSPWDSTGLSLWVAMAGSGGNLPEAITQHWRSSPDSLLHPLSPPLPSLPECPPPTSPAPFDFGAGNGGSL